MTEPQKEATRAIVESFRELPLTLQLVVMFIAIGGLPTATQLVTIAPRVATVEAQQDTMRSAIKSLEADMGLQTLRIDSLVPLVRDVVSFQTYAACQDRFRQLPNASEVCRTVQEEIESILRRAR